MTRRRAPQVETAPPVVRVRVVNGQEIARCPTRNYAPVHWIPEHAIEECHPEARRALQWERMQIDRWERTLIERVRALAELKRERATREIRDRYNEADG